MAETRLSYVGLKKIINDWNEKTPEEYPKYNVTCWGGFYHISRKDNHKQIACGEYPLAALKEFRQWEIGFYEGMNFVLRDK